MEVIDFKLFIYYKSTMIVIFAIVIIIAIIININMNLDKLNIIIIKSNLDCNNIINKLIIMVINLTIIKAEHNIIILELLKLNYVNMDSFII